MWRIQISTSTNPYTQPQFINTTRHAMSGIKTRSPSKRRSQSPRSSPDRFISAASRASFHSSSSPQSNTHHLHKQRESSFDSTVATALGLDTRTVLQYTPKHTGTSAPLTPSSSPKKSSLPIDVKPYKILDAVTICCQLIIAKSFR